MPTAVSNVSPKGYTGFDGQYIGGSWRPGKQGEKEVDTDPYSGETLAEIAMANQNDLDEAYSRRPKLRLVGCAPTFEAGSCDDPLPKHYEARHEEIVDWLIRESGSTRSKAELEWQFIHAITLEASSFPHRVEGRILPLDEPGKESRAYCQPLGVIGVISPWNFPMYLSHRSVGPALALGNGVVIKPAQDTPITGGLLIAKIYEEAGLPPPPHVFVDVKNDMQIAQDEMFGPIALIIKVNGEAEALQVANDTQYGLSSAVFTRDKERGLRFALSVQAGMTHVNDHSVDDTSTGPFGGEKNSGIGRFGGDWIIHEFTRDHWVTIRHTKATYPF